ncbi:MAG: HNH endonuclease [Chloroflexia bacterium]|nr:HNH endonuclease [Chloroflexia bacterium]
MTKFRLQTFHRNISDEELIKELKRVHSKLQEKGKKLTYRSYQELGKYSSGIFSSRFGSWNNALKEAGLELNQEMNVSQIDLFKNLEEVWISKGMQPVWRDMYNEPSKFGAGIYKDRFGSWRSALEQFVEYINDDSNDMEESTIDEPKTENDTKETKRRRTSRNISERMRFRILVRDGFTCQSCGASPLKSRGVELHVDHIVPWSKGGETEDENLETKCSKCNLGKGNAFDK